VQGLATSASQLERRHWFLLGVLGAAAFFQGYDLNLVAVALPQLRHTFGLTQAQASLWLSLLFMGALPAVLLTRQADRRGRRRVLLASVIAYSVATGFTALATTVAMFALCQFFARMFLCTEEAVAWTMVAEEMPAGSRGFGFGWMAMLAALGTGASAILYGPVGLSWRVMYLLALPPLAGVAFLRRRLPESRRFQRAERKGELAGGWRRILQPPHRRWLLLLSLCAVLGALTTHAATLAPDFLQTQRHLSRSTTGLLIVGAGAPALVVLLAAGSLSDRLGRKLVGCSFAALAVVGALDFFFFARSPFGLYVAITITLIGTMGARPALGAFGTELFPTPLRALGGSTVSIASVGGQALSLGIGGLLLHVLGSLPDTVAVLVLGPVAMIVVVAVFFPETHRRELEDISGPLQPLAGAPVGAEVLVAVPGGGAEPARADRPVGAGGVEPAPPVAVPST
jgi:putative MFS transporter